LNSLQNNSKIQIQRPGPKPVCRWSKPGFSPGLTGFGRVCPALTGYNFEQQRCRQWTHFDTAPDVRARVPVGGTARYFGVRWQPPSRGRYGGHQCLPSEASSEGGSEAATPLSHAPSAFECSGDLVRPKAPSSLRFAGALHKGTAQRAGPYLRAPSRTREKTMKMDPAGVVWFA